MTILKLYCGETGLTVSYLGPCGASGNLASGRVWGPMSSTGSWTISEEEDNGSRNWVEIQIHHPPADSDDTVLFLLKGELSISTEAVVDDTNLVDPNRFRFKNGRTWPEMLATLSDYSKKESELRRELSRINWNEIHRLVESKEE